MGLSIKVNGMIKKVLETAEVFKSGKMDQGMTDSGRMVWHMEWVVLFTQKATFMRVNGLKIKLMVMEYNKITKVAVTKETGITINKMEKELKNGQMVQCMKASINTE